MNFDPDYPIIIAFAGNAGAGKTSTANTIVPSVSVNFGTSDKDGLLPPMVWNHLFFASPLYEMVSIRHKTEGIDKSNRILYGLHDVVYDLLQRRCDYEDLIELVYDLYHLDCREEGDKARTFLQTAGDYCRAIWPDVFADKAIRSINGRFREITMEYERSGEDPPYSFNIISDLRMRNELELVKSRPNSMVIKFTADQEVLDQRLLDRGGKILSNDQKKHKSESELTTIADEEYYAIVDTTNYTLPEQAQLIRELIMGAVRTPV